MNQLHRRAQNKGYTIYFLLSIFFCLGLWGYSEQHLSFIDALYSNIKLIVINGEEHAPNWQIELARFALPLFTIGAVVKLFVQVIGQKITFLSLKLFPPHMVVFSTTKLAFVSSILANRPGKKLFIDISKEGIAYYGELPDRNYKLLHLPELSFEQLNSLNLKSAETIYLVALQDETNIALAQSIIPLLNRTNSKPRLLINVANRLISRIANQEHIFEQYRSEKGEIVWGNAIHSAARLLLQKRPPLRESSLSTNGILHIGIVGFTRLTGQLILNIMRNCVYLNIHQIYLSIFSQHPEAYEQFLQENPLLLKENQRKQIYGGGGFPLEANHYVCRETHISPALLTDVIAKYGEFNHIYVTDDIDYMVLEACYKIRQSLTALQVPAYLTACLFEKDLAYVEKLNLVAQANKVENQDIYYFSMIQSSINYPYEEAHDVLSLIIHTAYQAVHSRAFPSIKSVEFGPQFASAFLEHIDSANKDWRESLQEGFRHSNRCAADHLFIKLRELGFELVHQKECGSQDLLIAELHYAIQQHLTSLLRLEHQRFYQERLTDGWLYAKQNDERQQLNCSLVPFEQISELEKHKDECMLRLIPFILAQPMVRQHYQLKKLKQAS
ncbi:MAG: hypothetical protein Q4D86_07260 [Pasteurella oralis]|uniref:hypothetical protein n=1 Tax=Pasteurella oralis TaxID=1071947 RepID=UPI00270C7C44|nr:hypothetical protein [Pasteurella oralis]